MSGSESTGINAEERELAYIWVGSDLECESAEWLVRICFTDLFFLSLRVDACHVVDVKRAWKVADYTIEERLYSFVFERSSAHHRAYTHF